MRILAADTMSDMMLDTLAERGHEVDCRPDLTATQLAELAPDYEVLVVRSTPVSADVFARPGRLKLVIRAGAGVNTIDVAAAADAGVFVSNVPGQNAIAVAELAMGLLLAVDRAIPDAVADLRQGKWNKTRYKKGQGLFGRDIGVLGMGAIGSEFARRARSFGMRVHVKKRGDRDDRTEALLEEIGAIQHGSLFELAEACDILSFHIPETEATTRIVDREFLAHVRPGAVIINTSRGELIDESALLEAMDSKGIRAGLDVYVGEPEEGRAAFHSELAAHPNAYGTHHIGGSTQQAQNAIAREVIGLITDFSLGMTRNVVNLDRAPRGSSTLIVRHHNKVGVLASVFDVLAEAEINVEQMENQIFAGGRAASATMRVSGRVSPEVRNALADLPPVIEVSVESGPERD